MPEFFYFSNYGLPRHKLKLVFFVSRCISNTVKKYSWFSQAEVVVEVSIACLCLEIVSMMSL